MEPFPWERVVAGVTQAAVLALLLERALALIFEQAIVAKRIAGRGIKEFVAFGCAWGICITWQFDVFSQVMNHSGNHRLGLILSALTVAGGSKVAVTLFELWGIKSNAAKAAGGTP
jgi:hypothetical protein